MQYKTLFTAILAAVALLAGCASHPANQASHSATASTHRNAAIIQPPATYKGTLPCADCPGTSYHLNLLANHRFVQQITYMDRNTKLTENGSWSMSHHGKTLVLQPGQGVSQQWKVLDHGKTLRLLNQNGHVIQTDLNYDLTRSPKFSSIR